MKIMKGIWRNCGIGTFSFLQFYTINGIAQLKKVCEKMSFYKRTVDDGQLYRESSTDTMKHS